MDCLCNINWCYVADCILDFIHLEQIDSLLKLWQTCWRLYSTKKPLWKEYARKRQINNDKSWFKQSLFNATNESGSILETRLMINKMVSFRLPILGAHNAHVGIISHNPVLYSTLAYIDINHTTKKLYSTSHRQLHEPFLFVLYFILFFSSHHFNASRIMFPINHNL